MSGLDLLYTRAEIAERNGNRDLAEQLGYIANKINHDFIEVRHGVAWDKLSQYMNDVLDGIHGTIADPGIYRRCNDTDSFQEWLDRWYIPRPVDADGELFDFNKIYDNGCGAIDRIYISERSIGGGKTSVIYNIVSHDEIRYAPNDLRAEEPDSIEKLRRDICNAWNGSICSQNGYECTDKDCEVNEWLARAEKLFGGDVE